MYLAQVGGRLTMKCIYRGSEYNITHPALTVTSSEVLGVYRGVAYRHQRVSADIHQPIYDLMYRGVAYRTGEFAGVPSSVSGQPEVTVSPQSPSKTVPAGFSLGLQRLSELEKVRAASLRKNLEERLEVAKAQGNQSLIQVLEGEARELSLTV